MRRNISAAASSKSGISKATTRNVQRCLAVSGGRDGFFGFNAARLSENVDSGELGVASLISVLFFPTTCRPEPRRARRATKQKDRTSRSGPVSSTVGNLRRGFQVRGNDIDGHHVVRGAGQAAAAFLLADVAERGIQRAFRPRDFSEPKAGTRSGRKPSRVVEDGPQSDA